MSKKSQIKDQPKRERWQSEGAKVQNSWPPNTVGKQASPERTWPGRLGPTPGPRELSFSPGDNKLADFWEGGINKDDLVCSLFKTLKK